MRTFVLILVLAFCVIPNTIMLANVMLDERVSQQRKGWYLLSATICMTFAACFLVTLFTGHIK